MRMISKYGLLPLIARFKAGLVGQRSVRENAAERIEIAAADESPALPAISLPNEFERVRGVEPRSTFELEHKLVSASRISHGPTIAYRLDNTVLADNTLYAYGGYEVSRSGGKRALLTGPHGEYAEGQLCTYAASNLYFGHWLRDALAMELLAEQRGLAPLSYVCKPWLHEPGYRKMVNLPGVPVSFALVKRLWVIDDLGLNASWIKRFKELRRRVRSVASQDGPSHVFISRGRSGSARELLNASAIIDLLTARGFVTIEPEALSSQEIVEALASARVVVSVEGSAINHAQYAIPDDAGVLVIQPPERFNAFHKLLMDFNGIRFGYVVGDPIAGGFTLEPHRLLRTLDLLEAAIV